MERMQKRGLSDVVTTVLIILLVLAAVAIIASYVLNVVNKGSAEVGGSAACTLVQLYPTECTYSTGTNPGTFKLTLKATKRGADLKVKALDVLLTDGTTKDVSKVPATLAAGPDFLTTVAVYTVDNLATKQYSGAQLAVTLVPEGGTATSTCVPSKIVDCITP